MDYRLGIIAIFVVTLPLHVCGWGTLEVLFVNYTNQHGTTATGECCDKLWFRCVPNGCDYTFKICLEDDMNSSDKLDADHCGLFLRETKEVDNRDNVYFDRRIADVANPISIRSEKLPDTMMLKVSVKDRDPLTATTPVDFLRLRLDDDALRLTMNEKGSYFAINSRTKLVVKIRSYCASGFTGRSCDEPSQP